MRITTSSNGTARFWQVVVYWKPGCAEVTSFAHNTTAEEYAVQMARQFADRADVARVTCHSIVQLGGRSRRPVVKAVKF